MAAAALAGWMQTQPLPRFTALSVEERAELVAFFSRFAKSDRVPVPLQAMR
jgi:hypothetical protein